MPVNWNAHTSLEIVIRRAGGRNRYNARRRFTATLRRTHIAESLRYRRVHDRGTQAALACELTGGATVPTPVQEELVMCGGAEGLRGRRLIVGQWG